MATVWKDRMTFASRYDPLSARISRLFVVILGFATTIAMTMGALASPPDGAIAELKALYRRPGEIPFPAENPFTDAKNRLGQALFFDPRLSGTGAMSCATCHNPLLGWEDGRKTALGNGSKSLKRASPTILNLAWAELLMWDGRALTLEEQATSPIRTEIEMNQTIPELVAKLGDIAGYRRMFREAFGSEEISDTRIAQAIATFERTIVSNKAPFDLWIEGDERAISASAKRGFALFNGKANCAACHPGWRFTEDSFHDIGLASEDIGRGTIVPENPIMQNAFKTPTLRNIAQRGPYMHDGSVSSLRDTIIHYDTGFIERASLSPEMRRLGLSTVDVDDLVAFLQTLTSLDDSISVPALPTKDDM